MFGVAARDFLDVTRGVRSHPACMSGKCPLIAWDRRCVMGGKSTGYGRSWKKWLAIYAVGGAVLYLIVYLLFFSGSGSGGGLY
jgi:hypothetical protein